MERIYHLVLPAAWEKDPEADYRTDSLQAEGFIHCSTTQQVAGSANRCYSDAPELLVLEMDPQRLSCPLRYEPARSGELFPHIHGPLNRSAVTAVHRMQRDEEGKWGFSVVC
jgi:uncharacterized protein (DUF952 family)